MVGVLYCSARQVRPNYREAVLLEASEYDWCHHDCGPFVRPTLFFCLQSDDRVLVGSRKALSDDVKMLTLQGKAVYVRFDSRSIWVLRTDSTELQLSQNYSHDRFQNAACVAEVHRRWLEKLGHVLRPGGVPDSATLIPTSEKAYFWVRCLLHADARWDVCSVWDAKGAKYKQQECVSLQDGKPMPQAALVVDPLHTTNDYQFVLKDGTVLADWAKARINNIPVTDTSRPQFEKQYR